jgi:hypothetical protein
MLLSMTSILNEQFFVMLDLMPLSKAIDGDDEAKTFALSFPSTLLLVVLCASLAFYMSVANLS